MNELAPSCTTTYGCDGSLALAVSTRPQFTLLQGGMRHRGTTYHLPTSTSMSELHATRRLSPLVPLFVCLAMACVLLAVWYVSDALVAQRRATAFEGMEVTRVVVAPGDCLWSIAREHGVAGATTEEVVTWIVEYNRLSTSAVNAGDLLAVPSVAQLS